MNAERKRLLDLVETNPDAWIGHHGHDKSYRPFLNKARELVAHELNCEAKDVVFVENASSGVNAVMRSIRWAKGDKVLYLNCAYGMVKSVLGYLKQAEQIELVEVPVVRRKPPTEHSCVVPDCNSRNQLVLVGWSSCPHLHSGAFCTSASRLFRALLCHLRRLSSIV